MPKALRAPTDPPNALNRYRNRIVGQGEEDPTQLIANPRNFRIHPHGQEVGLEGVLQVVGWVARVMVNRRTGFVVNGHLRVAHAISMGEATIPVEYVDLDDAEEALILATFDPLASLASPDVAKRDELYDQLQVDTANALRILFGAAEPATGSGYGGGTREQPAVGPVARWAITFPSSAADEVREALTQLTETVEGLTWTENA